MFASLKKHTASMVNKFRINKTVLESYLKDLPVIHRNPGVRI